VDLREEIVPAAIGENAESAAANAAGVGTAAVSKDPRRSN
jgi:hypothetical protein